MNAPIHKTCYRCDRAIPAFVDPADVLGGQHGVCADCLVTTAALEAGREFRMAHPEQYDVAEIPRENISSPGGLANQNEGNADAPESGQGN